MMSTSTSIDIATRARMLQLTPAKLLGIAHGIRTVSRIDDLTEAEGQQLAKALMGVLSTRQGSPSVFVEHGELDEHGRRA